MEISKLPVKLGKEPLVEAVFELRFEAATPASTLLPGVFFGAFGPSSIAMSRLPGADLPAQLRAMDPNLQFAPLVRLDWQEFMILIGDQSVAVACKLPYPGWAKFQPAIMKVFEIAAGTGLVQSMSRYSMKYVNLVRKDSVSDQVASLDWEVRLGKHRLEAESAVLRVELVKGDLVQAVQILTAAQAQVNGAEGTQKGIVVDVDSICNLSNRDFSVFAKELPERLETIHQATKAMFFECLTPAMFEELEPIYD
ncbi:TIGR04255 family protein [Variovorax saccharolyticus]|uniref:TIGR04255 family protein n=1 Tax=Variovorax saccharolyticus TaxID=3053516 RepID=UPI002576C344|nr:TIGR04255 family protein [Variovorax sp. J31P216]MDM0025753.1 TIGR04255 family protein [Variovorax sp. J31P216]